MKQLQNSLPDTIARGSVAPDTANVQLGALYEPPPVEFSLEPVGWSILAVIIGLGLLILVGLLLRKYIKNRYRREALQTLDSIRLQEAAFDQVFVLLKQVAMNAYGREKVASLSGHEWLQFLEQTGQGVQLLNHEEQVNTALYTGNQLPEEAKDQIVTNAKQWVKTHASKF